MGVYDLGGGTHKCYQFMQRYMECRQTYDVAEHCFNFLEDQQECLHHSNERKRVMVLKNQLHRTGGEGLKVSKKSLSPEALYIVGETKQ